MSIPGSMVFGYSALGRKALTRARNSSYEECLEYGNVCRQISTKIHKMGNIVHYSQYVWAVAHHAELVPGPEPREH